MQEVCFGVASPTRFKENGKGLTSSMNTLVRNKEPISHVLTFVCRVRIVKIPKCGNAAFCCIPRDEIEKRGKRELTGGEGARKEEVRNGK